jgi:gliding motility-associated-like protein
MRRLGIPSLFVLIGSFCLVPLPACAQLGKWLLRGNCGDACVLDLTGQAPSISAMVQGFGTGGTEDVNLMTDAGGNILFSSAVGANDRIQVRNGSFQPMPNGSGLLGNHSSQASAIVPRPCHGRQYYLIHHDAEEHKHYYTIIDMDLGAQGDVAAKNILLGGGMGEGIAVSKVLPNGCRWLFTFGLDGNAYVLKRARISRAGISDITTIATIGAPGIAAWWSALKISAANDRLALSLPWSSPAGAADVVVWPLDIATGSVGAPALINVSDDPIGGIEFSPGGNFLYFVGNGPFSDMDFGRLRLSNHTAEVIDPAIGPWVLSIECARNGRLYVGTTGIPRSLGEVRYPDASTLAAAAYDRYAIIAPGFGLIPSLPNSIEGEAPGTAVTPDFIDFTVEELPGCEGHRFRPLTCLASSHHWQFGDGWTDQREEPTHRYGVGTFNVTLTVEACGEQLTLTKPALITVEGIQPQADFLVADSACQRHDVHFSNASQLSSEHRWWFGDGGQAADDDPVHAFQQPGTHTVTLVALQGCIADTARKPVKILPAALASFHTKSDPCDERTYFVNTTQGGAHFHWDFGDGDTTDSWYAPVHIYRSMGQFNVQLTTDPGTMCADTAMITLHAGYGLIPVEWYVPNAFTPNNDGNNDVLRIRGPEVCASPVMTIHNKWGQQVWEGDAGDGWDGTVGGAPAPEGVYAYVLRGPLPDLKHGWFVLAR